MGSPARNGAGFFHERRSKALPKRSSDQTSPFMTLPTHPVSRSRDSGVENHVSTKKDGASKRLLRTICSAGLKALHARCDFFEGARRIIGKAQGYRGLPIGDVTVNRSVHGKDVPVMAGVGPEPYLV